MSTVYRDTLFWSAVVFCAIAQLFIIRAVLRTATRSPTPEVGADNSVPSEGRGERALPVPRRSIEIAWAVLPAALLVVAFVGAWRLMHPESP